ncbi:MAG: hypothetical protein KDB00_29555, partial [Planctomycetales bacterium]|nr:hypothetical protein [Planctomycetales bacterium]
ITFSEPIQFFELADLTLRLDGGANLLSGSPATLNDLGNGVWSLGGLNSITQNEGTYELFLDADVSGIKDLQGLPLRSDLQVRWAVDTTAPTVTVNALTTSNARPPLTGTINDPLATVSVTVNGASYAAQNIGDGTWRLAAGVIAPLPAAIYDVSVTATDIAQNVAMDSTTNELQVSAAVETLITLDSNGNLLIRDITNDSSDHLRLWIDSGNLIIADESLPPLPLGTDIAGANGDTTSTISVPLNQISGGIKINVGVSNNTLADQLVIDFATGGFFAVPGLIEISGSNFGGDSLRVTGTHETRATYSSLMSPLGPAQLLFNEASGGQAIQYDNFETLVFDQLESFLATNTLNIGARSLTIGASQPVNLSSLTILDGGTLTAELVALDSAETIRGSGLVAARLAGESGSLIMATGTLSIGNGAAADGFQTAGEIRVGGNVVNLLDANQAVLGSLTTLGVGVQQGTLHAPRGLLLDFGRNISGNGTLDMPNDIALLSMFNGAVDGASSTQRITIDGYIKGIATFNNVTFGANSTHSPGFSPALTIGGGVDYANDSILEIEIGGLTPGASSQSDPNGYDQLQHTGAVNLEGDLVVRLIGGYEPQDGDSFTIITAEGGVTGMFETASLPPLTGGLEWGITYNSNDVQLSVLEFPAVESVVVNGGVDTQRSMLNSVTVTFSAEVEPAALVGAFQIKNLNTNLDAGTINIATIVQNGKTIATLTFSGQSTEGPSLSDGNYRLTIAANDVRATSSGRVMNADFVFGSRLNGGIGNDNFFRLFGDTDGDRDVDGQDYGRFGLAFLQHDGDPAYNKDLDFDLDGDIDGNDYGQFTLRAFRSL